MTLGNGPYDKEGTMRTYDRLEDPPDVGAWEDRLRADCRRLADNHDQVVGWLREKEAELEQVREALEVALHGRSTQQNEIERLREVERAARVYYREFDHLIKRGINGETYPEQRDLRNALRETAASGSTKPPDPAP